MYCLVEVLNENVRTLNLNICERKYDTCYPSET